ncbi:MAG: hypothetical protein CME62_07895 [Halobacteriovoraceae bacterium]|nr:hypothetical protein [Halobacteriovoraceae bacterium]|tara:strand:+ start:524 stop:898 length:375 start_codon:yes stop_codon:yes gene_type:complete
MNSLDLSLYLRNKKSAHSLKKLIYQRLKHVIQKLEHPEQSWDMEIIDTGSKRPVTSYQFIHLLNDYINGDISKFELHFILNAIEVSEDLIVTNQEAIKILYFIASPLMEEPMSIHYIKSVIYRP